VALRDKDGQRQVRAGADNQASSQGGGRNGDPRRVTASQLEAPDMAAGGRAPWRRACITTRCSRRGPRWPADAALAADLGCWTDQARKSEGTSLIEQRIVTLYSSWGTGLSLDALLARARPTGRYDAWRRGEEDELGSKAITSGLQMRVAAGKSAETHCRTIDRFLRKERRFLEAARKVAGPRCRSELSTTLFVEYPPREGVQTQQISLPSALLRVAAQCGVQWSMAVQQDPSATQESAEGRPTSG
jgi:hypothetical protein